MTIQETLAEGIALLKSPCDFAFIDTPVLDASILLADMLEADKAKLILRGNEPLAEKDRIKYKTLLERRRSGECVAYILGHKEFRGLRFSVNPFVLVPRPDTETLVEAALEYIDSQQAYAQDSKSLALLDLCTGCGALAISLMNERPMLSATASDISVEALETARLNAKRLLPETGAVNFIQSDLFEKITGRFDIIVSNPPYVSTGDLPDLAPEVRREPDIALDGGEDGLCVIGKIIMQAQAYLFPGGALLLEAGTIQMPTIRTLLETHGFVGIRVQKDLTGRDRVISCSYSGANQNDGMGRVPS